MSEQPKLVCDLVMKGGITSGVVYPRAVEEVAKRFYLAGIAGTSAGAIAASLAAAAEYRRRTTGSFEGFERVAELGNELAEKGRLLGLFRPDRKTRKLFRTVRKMKEKGLSLGMKVKLLRMAVRLEKTLSPVTDNFFGLCTGMANGNRKRGVEPLSEWLADRIDEVAGRKKGEPPLTFRDLHEAGVPEVLRRLLPKGGTERAIDFRAVTTCLSFGRPYEFPLSTNIFAFDPEELEKLFPKRVVDFLVEKGKAIPSENLKRDGKLPLTNPDLPVVVATRMSLSFPVLLSMVPLWAVDYRRESKPLQRVWFSDGGITSNFPMHRFDALYPQWPTLGVTLATVGASEKPDRPALLEPDVPEEERLIYLPRRRSENTLDRWNHFDAPESAVKDLMGFLLAMFRSAQTWHDEAYLGLPGFRDRSVEIWMRKKEGGLNLDMDREVVTELAQRGRAAGRMISERFAAVNSAEPMSWDSHRWGRFQSGMAAVMDSLAELRHAVEAPPMGGGKRLEVWLSGQEEPPAHRYRKAGQAQREADREAVTELLALLQKLEGVEPRPFQKAPQPRVELGVRAPF